MLSQEKSPPLQDEPQARFKNLWKHYSKADPGGTAENDLIRQYLPLVKTVIGRLALTLPPHIGLEDLYSAGLIGLLNAVRRFDPKNGASFETYARVRIRGTVMDELRRLNWMPRSVHDKSRKVQETLQRLEQEKGELPSDAEMARAMNLSMDEYDQLQEEIRPASFVCLDAIRSPGADESASPYESVPDDRQPDPSDGVQRREMTEIIARRLSELPEMQRKVLALYYFEDLRLREIAEVFGVSESRICQVHSQAIRAIRSELEQHDRVAV
jgi:RNA polymerase sigma factor for flagellar operon FliA